MASSAPETQAACPDLLGSRACSHSSNPLNTLLALLALVLIALSLSGCMLGLSGGSVPIGTVDGTVFLPARATAAPGVLVLLLDETGATRQSTLTDEAGRFAFPAAPVGDLTLSVANQSRSAKVRFTLVEHGEAHVGLMLTTIDPRVTSITLNGPALSGDTLEMNTQGLAALAFDGAQNSSGQVKDLPVSWAVIGGVGRLTPEGQFLALAPGAGALVVQYGNVSQTYPVLVRPMGASDGSE